MLDFDEFFPSNQFSISKNLHLFCSVKTILLRKTNTSNSLQACCSNENWSKFIEFSYFCEICRPKSPIWRLECEILNVVLSKTLLFLEKWKNALLYVKHCGKAIALKVFKLVILRYPKPLLIVGNNLKCVMQFLEMLICRKIVFSNPNIVCQ